jgi:hypothetical protein
MTSSIIHEIRQRIIALDNDILRIAHLGFKPSLRHLTPVETLLGQSDREYRAP